MRRLVKVEKRIDQYGKNSQENHDRRWEFARAYKTITNRLQAKVYDDKYFEDPEWVVELSEHFADHYFYALEDTPDWIVEMSKDFLKNPKDGIIQSQAILAGLLENISSETIDEALGLYLSKAKPDDNGLRQIAHNTS